MPRKTKREKILARLRRLQNRVEDETKPVVTQPSVQISLDSKPKTLDTKSQIKQLESDTLTYDYSYVYKDIRKIIILTAIALTLEIFLSLTASSSYAKLVLRTLNLDF